MFKFGGVVLVGAFTGGRGLGLIATGVTSFFTVEVVVSCFAEPVEVSALPDDAMMNADGADSLFTEDDAVLAALMLSLEGEAAGADTDSLLADEDAGAEAALSLAALADALSDAAANASGTAKSSDTNAAKRNNLFIIIPPKTLLFFF